MPEKSPEKKENGEERPENKENCSGGDDQKRRSYYYDDAHGYEVYNPDEDVEDGEE